MNRKLELTVEFIAGTSEKFTEANKHEKIFWTEFLKDSQALEDFYIWYFLEVFRDCQGFEPVAEKLIQRDETAIYDEIIKRLPEESATYFTNLLNPQRGDELAGHLREKLKEKIQQQFKPPTICNVRLVSDEEERETFNICKLSNATRYRLDSAQILTTKRVNRLIVLEKGREIFDGSFSTLSAAQEGFLKLYGGRPENRHMRPCWENIEFDNEQDSEEDN